MYVAYSSLVHCSKYCDITMITHTMMYMHTLSWLSDYAVADHNDQLSKDPNWFSCGSLHAQVEVNMLNDQMAAKLFGPNCVVYTRCRYIPYDMYQ